MSSLYTTVLSEMKCVLKTHHIQAEISISARFCSVLATARKLITTVHMHPDIDLLFLCSVGGLFIVLMALTLLSLVVMSKELMGWPG